MWFRRVFGSLPSHPDYSTCGGLAVASSKGPESPVSEEMVSGNPSAGRRAGGLFLLAAVGVGAVVLLVYAVAELPPQHATGSRFAPKRWVNLDSPQSRPASPSAREAGEKAVLRIAVAPVISPEKSLELYQEFVDYLAERLHRTPVFLQRGSYAEVNDLIRYRQCDMAFVCTCAFVRGEREFGMEVLVVPEIGGQVSYQSLVLVPSGSEADSLLDLRGKRFASADVLSTSGWLFPATWLMNEGEDPESFFDEHLITRGHDRSVSAVSSGYADAAAVHSLVYAQTVEEDPSVGEKTRVIVRSPPFGMPPVVVPAQLDRELKDLLRAAMLKMHTDPLGRKTLAPLHIDRFVMPVDGLYDTVREASARWESRQ